MQPQLFASTLHIQYSNDSIWQELERTETLLKNIAGHSSKLFRPPYGETNQRVDSIAQKLGLTTVMYDLASGDPDSTISEIASCSLRYYKHSKRFHYSNACEWPRLVYIRCSAEYYTRSSCQRIYIFKSE